MYKAFEEHVSFYLHRTPAALSLLLLGLLSCVACRTNSLETAQIAFCTGGQYVPVVVELALTEEAQRRGYMGRTRIPDGTGMLFVYKQDTRLSFWMKDTPHPLSLAFLDAQGAIVQIEDLVPLSTHSVRSNRSVRYALEVPRGWFVRSKLLVGARLSARSLARIRRHADPPKGQSGDKRH
ncbi:DUF192 domain-containing protein [Treponema pallidum]|uniref:DUF192 domain-containing protein n=2 Tax=Treponema pallidum subsp. pallidum TaxID=161 RepID=O83125_TREPA|nr:conserved hypothetical protein [Treponema pallidum subsp. pallidum str. Nichols]ACD70514.1 hypothetical protein TPASS_0087 [Treponema pallidum subsp. pallidum SS14]ADD72240.1 lipoprotein, putative [Treponema pallidum subsp. pallidum str. Chicago]AFU66118.1 hypothetical protein TPAMA_0087 [Treponema pallidum subsp. pallidum str. Mexico A]QCQ78806.1 hypothetical protein TPAGR_0087 [Treponema pallidum subsp. pallidum]WBP09751.1 DUF192 domain-containing protein [Treponema pallidum]